MVTEREIDKAVKTLENPRSTHAEKTAAWGVAYDYVLQENARAREIVRHAHFRRQVALS